MYITNEMINPELRTKGELIRFALPYFKESTFRKINKLMKVMRPLQMKGINFQEVYIRRKNNTLLRVCVYSPLDIKENATGVLWIHGGGFAIGRPEQDESSFIKRFVLENGCVVVSPDYTLSTEEPYPAALKDCYRTLLWMKNHGKKYNIRQDQIIVGGDSAGGGLTAALAIYARDRKEVAIAFQMPLYPMLDDRMITPSSQNNDAPVWNTKSNINGWKLYLDELYGTEDVPAYAAPSRLENYENLPPAITFIGSIEPFRDEAIEYMENLKKAGISAEYEVFDGCFHAFDFIASKSSPGKAATQFLMDNFTYAQNNYFAEQPTSEKEA